MDTDFSTDWLPSRIETARLVLRAPHMDDVPTIARLANNEKIHRMTARVPFPYGTADAIAFVEDFAQRPEERPFVITVASDGVAGVVGLTFQPGEAPELGYWLGEPYWGRGLATEAVQALVQAALGRRECPALIARAISENRASRAILEKIGFVLESEAIAACGPHSGVSVARYRIGATGQ
ncbi:GNAT family N-acetyltransferase [Pelagibacterium limicola]|uniref:GNAT family N-acetyltransferase n=1 Tax=Pelagibacterium limicola TaxID=2791022 RepID=UPI0018B01308|nr:GNAT family N-acetyltransferase [Pelagibacterium limicola]